jgi:hypothetical protein
MSTFGLIRASAVALLLSVFSCTAIAQAPTALVGTWDGPSGTRLTITPTSLIACYKLKKGSNVRDCDSATTWVAKGEVDVGREYDHEDGRVGYVGGSTSKERLLADYREFRASVSDLRSSTAPRIALAAFSRLRSGDHATLAYSWGTPCDPSGSELILDGTRLFRFSQGNYRFEFEEMTRVN